MIPNHLIAGIFPREWSLKEGVPNLLWTPVELLCWQKSWTARAMCCITLLCHGFAVGDTAHSIFISVQCVSHSLDCNRNMKQTQHKKWPCRTERIQLVLCCCLDYALEDQSILEAKKEMDPRLQRTAEWWIRDLKMVSGCKYILFLLRCFFCFFLFLFSSG